MSETIIRHPLPLRDWITGECIRCHEPMPLVNRTWECVMCGYSCENVYGRGYRHFADEDGPTWAEYLINEGLPTDEEIDDMPTDLDDVDDYQLMLDSKRRVHTDVGFTIEPSALNPALKDFQRDIVAWALRRGRAAMFEDTGLGKSFQQIVWADEVSRHTGKPVLILAPLMVAAQTVGEGSKFGIAITLCRSQKDVADGVNITNYEMLHHFDVAGFSGVVIDESSILKSLDGATRDKIIESFADTPYRLACTATPAPNDLMELGNHAEFLGIMSRTEMLAMFFTHDGGDTAKWRLKGHAEQRFYSWVCSWAVYIRRPSDLNYDDTGYILPPLNYHHHIVDVEHDVEVSGQLFAIEARGLNDQRSAKKLSRTNRINEIVDRVNAGTEPCIVWCEFNPESEALTKLIHGAVEITGSMTSEQKEKSIKSFLGGETRVIVSKVRIIGFGLNFQHCRWQEFCGMSNSFESFYQAVRRSWRFGVKGEVDIHITTGSTEGAIIANINRKMADTEKMASSMVEHMKEISMTEITKRATRDTTEYRRDVAVGDNFTSYLGDCVEVWQGLPDNSIGYTIYSPPFASLYCYSNSDRDMGNCADDAEFESHFRFLLPELYRVTMPGRLMSFHCMNLPSSKTRDGVIGIKDFRGDLIRWCEAAGWIYHSEVVIWKDPVTAMQRTKALGLLHKTLRKDSSMSRQGIPDYLVTMRKPGINPVPINHYRDEEEMYAATDNHPSDIERSKIFPVQMWQKYASPVWMDINPSKTLQYRAARENNDERHICPLQLQVIERGIELWSTPGDLVASPFSGIGSEGYVALKMGRKFIGAELKESYWNVGLDNLRHAERESRSGTLFDLLEQEETCLTNADMSDELDASK